MFDKWLVFAATSQVNVVQAPTDKSMSHLQYYAYPGVGVENRKHYSYSQAVKVGDRIELAGQGAYMR